MKKTALAILSILAFQILHAGALGSAPLENAVDKFNADDEELYAQHIPNARAKEFLKANIPLFECPDETLQNVYYFRWWTFRKHIRKTPDGFVIGEFLPNVGWADKYNMISCAAALHIREARWLKNPQYARDYLRIWFSDPKTIRPRKYSFWPADSALELNFVHPNKNFLKELFPKLKDNFFCWETERKVENSPLFWQSDNKDGMECSISGYLSKDAKGIRATINSYMYAEAAALAQIAEIVGAQNESFRYKRRAKELKEAVDKTLWDESANFYKVIPLNGTGKFSPVRELHGYTPWLFNIPPASRSVAWEQIKTEDGFKAPFGLTTAERRNPKFAISYKGHECLWNGPSWPYATSITLSALANLLNNYQQDTVQKEDYFDALKTYALAHSRVREDGKKVFWIDENINPLTGDWISRTRLKTWKDGNWHAPKGGRERGKDYNHSTFCDLIITGLVGVRPSAGNTLAINPLTPEDWSYFCLDNLPYKGRNITILFDKDGSRYRKGKGFKVYVNGALKASAPEPQKVEVPL